METKEKKETISTWLKVLDFINLFIQGFQSFKPVVRGDGVLDCEGEATPAPAPTPAVPVPATFYYSFQEQ